MSFTLLVCSDFFSPLSFERWQGRRRVQALDFKERSRQRLFDSSFARRTGGPGHHDTDFATQDRLRQVDVGKNKRSLPANRLDLSFPYRSLLDIGLVADAGTVPWSGLSTADATAQQELDPISLRDHLPVSTSSSSYPHSHLNSTYILRCLTLCERRNHPPLQEERYYNPRLQAISRTTKRQPRGPCPEESSPVYSPRDLWRLV